jgi:hypothetical protein
MTITQLFCETTTAATLGVAGAALLKMNPFLGAAMATAAYVVHQVALPAFHAIDSKGSKRIEFAECILALSWLASLSQIIQWGAAKRGYPVPLLNTTVITFTSVLLGEHIGEFIYKGATQS